MGRRARPYSIFDRDGVAWINAQIGFARTRRSLEIPYADRPDGRSEGHVRRIAEAAAQAYAELVTGRLLRPQPEDRVQSASTLHELSSLWLADDAKVYPASAKLSITHASHWGAFADDDFRGFAEQDATPKWQGDRRTPLERLTSDTGPTDYVLERLRTVLKETVIKEVSTLFRFLAWAKARGHISSVPPRPEWPKKALGVRSGPQRAAPVETTHEEMLAIIAELPEWASRGGRGGGKRTPKAIPVRDLAELAYITGLRPSTIARLSSPEHFARGADRLFIPPEIDKGRNKARYVPLTKRARAIIEKHLKPGVIFGKHDLRTHWKRAAAAVLSPERAAAFSLYDFRHGAGRHMVRMSRGNLLGVAHMLGHKHLTTTNRYLAPAEADGAAVVAALETERIRSRIPSRSKKSETRGTRKPRKNRSAKEGT